MPTILTMSNVGDIKSAIANYLKQPVSAFVIGSGDETVDMLQVALNNARRTMERLHDFYSAQLNAYLSVAATGGNTNNASSKVAPQTSGLLVIGATYIIATFVAGDNFTNVGALMNATGVVFVATGTTPTTWTQSSSLQTVLNIKNVSNVLLPISGGYLPVEFLDNNTWIAKFRQQAGRVPYVAGNTPVQYGMYLENPVAVQQGNIIYVYPSTGAAITYPILVQLDAITFLANYINDSQTDFFTLNGPEALMWQGIMEGNKLWSQFVKVQEGIVDEESIGQMAQTAFESLIIWDRGIAKGTSAKEMPMPLLNPPRQAREPKERAEQRQAA